MGNNGTAKGVNKGGITQKRRRKNAEKGLREGRERWGTMGKLRD